MKAYATDGGVAAAAVAVVAAAAPPPVAGNIGSEADYGVRMPMTPDGAANSGFGAGYCHSCKRSEAGRRRRFAEEGSSPSYGRASEFFFAEERKSGRTRCMLLAEGSGRRAIHRAALYSAFIWNRCGVDVRVGEDGKSVE